MVTMDTMGIVAYHAFESVVFSLVSACVRLVFSLLSGWGLDLLVNVTGWGGNPSSATRTAIGCPSVR